MNCVIELCCFSDLIFLLAIAGSRRWWGVHQRPQRLCLCQPRVHLHQERRGTEGHDQRQVSHHRAHPVHQEDDLHLSPLPVREPQQRGVWVPQRAPRQLRLFCLRQVLLPDGSLESQLSAQPSSHGERERCCCYCWCFCCSRSGGE